MHCATGSDEVKTTFTQYQGLTNLHKLIYFHFNKHRMLIITVILDAVLQSLFKDHMSVNLSSIS